MGFGARLVLGCVFLFSISVESSFGQENRGNAAFAPGEGVVDELIEDISRLQDYVPSVGDKALIEKLADAEALARAGKYDEAGAQVLKIKNRLIGEAFKELSYVQNLKNWQALGFFPTTDNSRDLLHELVVAISHIHDDFSNTKTDTNQVSALCRFITLQNLISVMRLRQDSAPYELNARAKALSHELVWEFLHLDGSRQSISDSSISRVGDRTEELGRLNAEFADLKRRESVAGATLVLNQLKILGPPDKGSSIFDYRAISETIEKIQDSARKDSRPQEPTWALGEESPYSKLFAATPARTDANEQFQILKLELARRALGMKKDPAAALELKPKIEALLTATGDEEFWLRVHDIRAQMNRVVPVAMNPMEGEQDAALLVSVAPDALQAKIQAVIGVYSLSLDRLRQNFDSTSTSWQKLNPWAQRRSFKALVEIEASLRNLARKVATTSDPISMAEIGRSLHWLPILCGNAVEAAMERASTAEAHSALLSRVVLGFNGQDNFVTQQHVAEMRRLLKLDRKEQVYRAWVNKDTITTAALTVMLVGEAVSIFTPAAPVAGAAPATLATMQALRMGGQAITWIARGAIAVSAGSNLVDRYRIAGWSGLANMDSAVDAMMVLSVMPRIPMVTPASKIATSRMGKLGQWMVRYTGQLQFSTTRALGQMMVAYSGYQLVYAESIAAEYHRMGVEVSPTEIRARAALGLATSALVLWQDRQALARARTSNPVATSEIEKSLSLAESNLSKRLKGMLNPYAAARDFYRVRPSWHRAIRGASVGIGYVGLDYLMVNETMLLAHTNPDFNYMYQVEKTNPFPTLENGESALSMVGINPLDTLLYFGAHAEFSHNRERKLYGNNYSVENYESPEDLIERLVRYAEIHGPIKYLKIMTHGRPGMLYSRKVDEVGPRDEKAVSLDLKTLADSGWIDANWIASKRDWIRERTRQAFAPNARIILWACLSGANYDEPKLGTELDQPIRVGDEFLAALGNSFLPKGGNIDASTRILIGLGSVFGSALRNASYAGRKVDEHYRPVVPIVPLDSKAPSENLSELKDVDSLAFKSVGPGFYSASLMVGGADRMMASPGEADGTLAGAWDSVKYTAGRAKYMFLYMPQIWWKYGIMLEGPWWHKWYQHVEVPPT